MIYPFRTFSRRSEGRSPEWTCYDDVELIHFIRDRFGKEYTLFARCEYNEKLNKIWLWHDVEEHRVGKGPDIEVTLASPYAEVRERPQHGWHGIFTYENSEGRMKFSKCWYKGQYYDTIMFEVGAMQLTMQSLKRNRVDVVELTIKPKE